jgi:hypothetical protein
MLPYAWQKNPGTAPAPIYLSPCGSDLGVGIFWWKGAEPVVTINKNLGRGRKGEESKIAAKPVEVATNKVSKAKAISAKGSVGEVHQTRSATQRGGAK